MATTPRGIPYPTDYQATADTPAALKALAESVDGLLATGAAANSTVTALIANGRPVWQEHLPVEAPNTWTAFGTGISVPPNLTVEVTVGGRIIGNATAYARVGFLAVNAEGIRFNMHDDRSARGTDGDISRSWLISTVRADQSAWNLKVAARGEGGFVEKMWIIARGWPA